MRVSCNGCRVLRKGCGDDCSIRPSLSWIKSPDSQANATVFLAKFYGRAGLINLISAGPDHLRPAIFRSLLYEACGRIVNPIYGSVGLLWSGSWHLCQAAVEAVLRGAPITPMTSEAAESIRGPPLKVHDIRHITKGGGDATGVRNRRRFKRTGSTKTRAVAETKGSTRPEDKDPCNGEQDRSPSHESSLSHQSEGAPSSGDGANTVDGDTKEATTDSLHSVETSEPGLAFVSEPEREGCADGAAAASAGVEVELELTLGFGSEDPSSRGGHVVPVKKRRWYEGNGTDGLDCRMGMGLGL
ncbi:hypothetical protein MLD38_001243 [Melastoma candidum]|uniref:Uncharacterized protein n=1 Tax=Melastoma candidum TaxID=119954 RepID=A0ACB9SCL3_9MYRT|nr:hypothetical protein MLD38_001243 [Melastoma candidum]